MDDHNCEIPATDPAFLAQIDADPTDANRVLVWCDHLQEAGDPGEPRLRALALAGKRTRGMLDWTWFRASDFEAFNAASLAEKADELDDDVYAVLEKGYAYRSQHGYVKFFSCSDSWLAVLDACRRLALAEAAHV